MKATLLISSLLLSVSLANASLIDVGYPPPGGVTLGQSGAPGIGTGKTFSYSDFDVDPILYSALYWGPVSVANVNTVGPGATGQMSYTGFLGGFYQFDSTVPWTLTSLEYGAQALPTRMLLSVAGALGPADTEANLGANVAPTFPLFQVNGDFSATFVFQAFENGVWVPTSDLVTQLNTFGATDQKSVTFHFFADPVTAPEPASMMLFGSGLAALTVAAVRRRRKA